jgi:hypothetical protein
MLEIVEEEMTIIFKAIIRTVTSLTILDWLKLQFPWFRPMVDLLKADPDGRPDLILVTDNNP